MTLRWTLVALVVLSALAPSLSMAAPSPSACATPAIATASTVVLTIEPSKPRLHIDMPRMPPTRTWCTFERVDGKESVTVTWDPLQPAPLRRAITFRPNPAQQDYQVACYSDPARHALEAQCDFAWKFQSATTSMGTGGFITFLAIPPEPKAIMVPLRVTELPKLEAVPAIRTEKVASPAPIGGAQRAFGAISEQAINELFQVIAEVVIEEAESRALRLLEKKMQKLLCDTLVAQRPTAGTQKLPLFPHACTLVSNIRIDDLAGAGRQLLNAFVQDFLDRAVDAAVQGGVVPASAKDIVDAVSDALMQLAMGKHEKARDGGRKILVALSTTAWNSKSPDFHLGFRFVLHMMSDCLQMGGCDVARIEDAVAHPDKYVDYQPPGNAGPATLKAAVAKFKAAADVISGGLSILLPQAGATEAEQLRAAADIVFDVVEFHHEVNAKLAEKQRVATLRALVDAAIDRDIAQIGASAAELIASLIDSFGACPGSSATAGAKTVANWRDSTLGACEERAALKKALAKVTRVAAAIGAYLNTYASGREPGEDETAARREARKDALRTLIRAQGARGERLGDWVFSIGSSLYASAGSAYLLGQDNDPWTFQTTPVSLTLGLGVDYHGPSRWGFHVELAPLNLGAYLTVRDKNGDGEGGATDPAPVDAFSPSITLGPTYLFEDGDLMLLIGPTFGFMPKLGDDNSVDQALYVGGLVGTYIPILDLN